MNVVELAGRIRRWLDEDKKRVRCALQTIIEQWRSQPLERRRDGGEWTDEQESEDPTYWLPDEPLLPWPWPPGRTATAAEQLVLAAAWADAALPALHGRLGPDKDDPADTESFLYRRVLGAMADDPSLRSESTVSLIQPCVPSGTGGTATASQPKTNALGRKPSPFAAPRADFYKKKLDEAAAANTKRPSATEILSAYRSEHPEDTEAQTMNVGTFRGYHRREYLDPKRPAQGQRQSLKDAWRDA